MHDYMKDFILNDIEPKREKAHNLMCQYYSKLDSIQRRNSFGLDLANMIETTNDLQFANGSFEALDDLYYELVARYNSVSKNVFGLDAKIILPKELKTLW